MAARIRALDWAVTPLGPSGTWSDRLRLMVEQILASPLVATLVCGPERLLLYNDAAAGLYGDRHPAALGRPLPEMFPEGWAAVAQFYVRAFAGESVLVKGQKVDTRGDGQTNESFDALLLPVRESDGRVAHVYMTGAEIGAREQRETVLRESKKLLAADLAEADLLRDLADRMVTEESIDAVYDEILSAAIAIARADAGTVQVFDARSQTLGLVATHNFARRMTDHFRRVDADSRTACGVALRSGKRTFLDFKDDDPDEACLMHVEAGVRSAMAIPLLSRAGAPLGMLNAHWGKAGKRPSEQQLRFLDLLARQAADLIEQRYAEKALRDSEARFRALTTAGAVSIYRMSPDWRLMYQLESPDFLANVSEPIEDWRDRYILPEDQAMVDEAISQAIIARSMFELEHRVADAYGGTGWVRSRAVPMFDANGDIVEWFGTGIDVTLRKQAEARQELLVGELQHRTRNLMGMVRSLADTTARASIDLEDFEAKFRDRLAALARVQGMLSRLAESDRITFDELLRTELTAHGALGHEERRVSLKGPAKVALRSSSVQIIAMALHELATNAIKHGALGMPHGRLAVEWRLEPAGANEPLLHVDWREGGVAMPAPAGRVSGGQGRELIEKALPYQLGAKTTFVLGPEGLHCTMTIPVSARTGAMVARHG